AREGGGARRRDGATPAPPLRAKCRGDVTAGWSRRCLLTWANLWWSACGRPAALQVLDPQLRVGVLPRGLDPGARPARVGALLLGLEGLPESEEGSRVARMLVEVRAEDFLGFGELS